MVFLIRTTTDDIHSGHRIEVLLEYHHNYYDDLARSWMVSNAGKAGGWYPDVAYP